MSMLFGMYEPDSGEIYIQGEKVTFRSSNDASAHNIGMVHQHFKLWTTIQLRKISSWVWSL